MADLQENSKMDMQSNYSVGNNSDPKNMQELTQYDLLSTKMSMRFELSDLWRVAKDGYLDYDSMNSLTLIVTSGKPVWHSYQVQSLLQQMQDRFQTMSDQVINRNEMGNRIDDLEKNIADLMTQAGVEGPEK